MTSLKSRVEYCLNLFRHSPLPDDRMMSELAATDEPRSNKLSATFMAVEVGNIKLFNRWMMTGVQEYAAHHGYVPRDAMTKMVLAQMNMLWVQIETIMPPSKAQD